MFRGMWEGVEREIWANIISIMVVDDEGREIWGMDVTPYNRLEAIAVLIKMGAPMDAIGHLAA